MDIQAIKQRFGIIGNSILLNRAIDIARQVAHTDITVLITGESGTGKDVFPKIIHNLSARKHEEYIAINCGAIPEGTIDSELFGHVKGSFTSADRERKGYFEQVDKGTIFLDEISELPLSTQVRLLRVLELGEFIKVGSSKVIKTDVRVVAASNINIIEAVKDGKFREDLFYRLNIVPIQIPTLRNRKKDIVLLFRKFASDFAEKYKIPPLQLNDEAKNIITNYRWNGNIRQLKNITEQISILEKNRLITAETLVKYLPKTEYNELPVIYRNKNFNKNFSERDLLYNVFFDMRRDITDLKKLVKEILEYENIPQKIQENNASIIEKINQSEQDIQNTNTFVNKKDNIQIDKDINEPIQESEIIEESLSISKKEIELIKKALAKYKGKRKNAAKELGISERTLYRKIKEYNIG
jgi:transcriptional regulator with PAS, ATPase and Fis domain